MIKNAPHTSSIRHIIAESPRISCAQQIPTELLLLIVRHATHESSKPTRRNILSLSSVCHEWFNICASVRYRHINLGASRIDSFCEDIRTPILLGVRTHIRSLTMRASSTDRQLRPGLLSKLAALLRQNLAHLKVECAIKPNEGDLDRHTPHSSKMVAGAYASFTNLTSLHLESHSFSSSQDLLRLFGSLASLRQAELSRVLWHHNPILAPFSKPSQLVEISCTGCSPIWPLILCSTWSRSSENSIFKEFDGLSREEAAIAAQLCQHTEAGMSGTADIQFGKSVYPHTCMCSRQCIRTEAIC